MDYFLSFVKVQADLGQGRLTEDQVDDMRRSLGDWKDRPGAFAAFARGEAIGRKP